MQRIVVLGIPGAGKSTFSRRLGEILELPVYHLDRYFWNPGWKASVPEQWRAKLDSLLARDRWILDGNYRSTIPLRLQYADTAIYLDIPRRVAFWRVFKRIVTYRYGNRPDMADGCPERWFDSDFMRYIWRYHQDVHPQTLAVLEEFAARPGTHLVHLRDGDSAERWIQSLQAQGGRVSTAATD